MYAAASGMAAQQTNLELIADNLANADVAGFKQMQARFTDVRAGGTLGLGTALAGPGFFRVERAGKFAYTRNGEFTRAADGALRTADGWRLRDVTIPAEAV